MPLIRTRVVILHTISFLANLLAACSANHAALPADAQLVQVPVLSGFGNSDNAFPFSQTSGPMRYQQIYASSAFPHGGTIDKIMVRNDEGSSGKMYQVDINLQIAFAYAATTVDTASPIFDNNIGDDFTIVFDGTTFQSRQAGPATTDFNFIVDVANTFTYDPSRGDLLMQVLARDTYHAFTQFDSSQSPQQNVTTRIWGYSLENPIGRIGLDLSHPEPYGLITQFQFVPEPSAIVQFGAMLLLMIARRRRHE
ncbi:MAG TPA: PEP-CTERM sorting domain-containing protein [Lacipirellulaceae bacterium]|jgi:hypothetical protein|nr:PEP-CTERM sorting domain-containing protein [Lacipirellulaceae bacterium]